MSKKKQKSKKELSEGKTIAIAVVLFTLGLVTAGYLLQYIVNYFFPNLF